MNLKLKYFKIYNLKKIFNFCLNFFIYIIIDNIIYYINKLN